MDDKQFKETIYELAFGCSAIDKDYSDEEVLAKIREFSDDALRSDEEVYVVQENGESMKSFLNREEAEDYAVNIDDGYDTDIVIKVATWRNDDDD
jgi:hypothetical protein